MKAVVLYALAWWVFLFCILVSGLLTVMIDAIVRFYEDTKP